MSRFRKWAEREYSAKQRMIVIVFQGILVILIIPVFLVQTASYLDARMQLPRVAYGTVNALLGIVSILIGWLLALWAVRTQFTLGRGTPAPMMPTQKLIVRGPYTYCRNPMAFGIFLFYLGFVFWTGSLSMFGLVLFAFVLLVVYIKVIEEHELAERFGSEYVEYKQNTPFLIPRLWKRMM